MKASFLMSVLVLIASAALVCAQDKSRRKTGELCAKPLDSSAATPAPVASPAAAPNARPSASTDEPGQIAGAFFALLQRNRVEEAYTNLTRGSKIADRPDELKALKTKTSEAIEMFGSIEGYELVETKAVGSHLIRRTYLSLGKEFPLRWRFYFYSAEGRWRLVDLRVDDRLTGIFDEPEEPQSSETTTTTK